VALFTLFREKWMGAPHQVAAWCEGEEEKKGTLVPKQLTGGAILLIFGKRTTGSL
jgi:hypothetical protein